MHRNSERVEHPPSSTRRVNCYHVPGTRHPLPLPGTFTAFERRQNYLRRQALEEVDLLCPYTWYHAQYLNTAVWAVDELPGSEKSGRASYYIQVLLYTRYIQKAFTYLHIFHTSIIRTGCADLAHTGTGPRDREKGLPSQEKNNLQVLPAPIKAEL